MKKRFFLPAMMLAVAFASCSNEEDATPQSSRKTKRSARKNARNDKNTQSAATKAAA